MKTRIAFVGLVVVVLAFGLVAYAGALSNTVTVSAKVAPAFSMKVDGVDATGTTFNSGGDVMVGNSYNSDTQPVVTVKSNKLWTYGWTATYSDGSVDAVLSETTGTPTGAGIGLRGVTSIPYSYTLDLTDEASAYQIPAETVLSATYTYTATQY